MLHSYKLETVFFSYPGQGGFTYTFEGKNYTAQSTSVAGIWTIFSIGTPKGEVPLHGATGLVSEVNTGRPESFVINIKYRYLATRLISPGTYSVVSAGFDAPTLMKNWGRGGSGYRLNMASLSFSSGLSVNNPSCKLTSPGSIQLIKTNLALIPTIGSSQEGARFSMSVTCPAAYDSYKVLYAMSDVNMPSNTSDRLSPENSLGAAKGVSLQILDDDIPVKFTQLGSTGLPTNGFGMMPATGGSMTKQFSARYIRTDANAAPGSLNAGASIILSYD